jgi:antiviral defense system Shedu protein SduA
MPIVKGIRNFILQKAKETEFDVETGNFADLEIRQRDQSDFYFFYDTRESRLISNFVLREGPQVDTMCDVVLIKKDDGLTPRLSFWKKDKTKGKVEDLTEEELVQEGRTILIKARVDTKDCHESYWKLNNFLRSCREIQLPTHAFRVAPAELVDALDGHDKTAVLTAVKTYLGGQVTEQDVQMLVDRRTTLEDFRRLLDDSDYFAARKAELGADGDEDVWQAFFEANPWIFGYGLTLVACQKYDEKKLERMTSGSNVFTGGGKRSDAVMRTMGFVQTLLFGEIKKHTTPLLKPAPYREPDVYQVDNELSGAVSQVQKTAHKAVRDLDDLHRAKSPAGAYQFDISTIRPRQVVVIGSLKQLIDNGEINEEKMSSFELYRRGQQEVEILTFDELFERARFIVESQEA